MLYTHFTADLSEQGSPRSSHWEAAVIKGNDLRNKVP